MNKNFGALSHNWNFFQILHLCGRVDIKVLRAKTGELL